MSVRAKFRTMEISQQWNGECVIVRLLPVIAKATRESGCWVDPEASEENRKFWDATPSGEAELVFKGLDLDAVPFDIGECVYIDIQMLNATPGDERAWQLEAVTSSHNLSVCFRLEWADEPLRSGVVKMDIANEGAWHHFQGHHLTAWDLTFTPAGV